MRDEQFEILVELINETKEELKEEMKQLKEDLESKITDTSNALRTEFTKEIVANRLALFHEANEIKEEIKSNREINEREHQTIMSVIEDRYTNLEKEAKKLSGDVKIIHTLAMQNLKEHKEYDRILTQNGLK